jgi:hypothetical protein
MPFVEKLHCIICKARRLVQQGKKVSIPHRQHDTRCHVNRKTRGLSPMTVFITRESAPNNVINNAPATASVLGRKLASKAGTNIGHFFSPYLPPNCDFSCHGIV